jgi:hypothetical protein
MKIKVNLAWKILMANLKGLGLFGDFRVVQRIILSRI